jgi:N-methylhydantoinase A
VSVRVGVDIGGTFTDFALLDAGGRLVVHKQLTTPGDPAEAVLTGLPVLLERAGLAAGDVTTLVHGTTLVTNALIERKGARTGMLVTAGFADVLDIAMERRYDMYDLRITYPEPLVPRRLRAEVIERIGPEGRILTPLDEASLRAGLERLVAEGIESLAICFLNSPVDAAHEEAARRVAQALYPHLPVSTSAEVFPFLREYERWTTTTMNAYTRPLIDRYLGRLEAGLREQGVTAALYVMTSSGGTVPPEVARRHPVRMLESGPAAGVLLAAELGRRLGHGDLLAFDMGGTTAKGALIRRFQPLKRYDMEVARVHEFRAGSGLPAKIPVLDLIEIGAGGGSVARIDERGTIRVGPESAGADPGPVCYGKGGTRPTLTDANLRLGYLSADYFLGGAMALDETAAATALETALATALGVEQPRAAFGVHETVSEDVARAFRNHASERGFDYRRAVMVAFGGSGPAHAARVARKLRVPTVVLPVGAGVLSALGLLVSPLAFELLRSERVAQEDLDETSFAARFAPLVEEAAAHLRPAGLHDDDLRIRRWVDARYRGQGYEIEVELPGAPEEAFARFVGLFEAAYERVFARCFPGTAIEIVCWKVEVAGPVPDTGTWRLDVPDAGEAEKGRRPAWMPEAGAFREVPVLDGYALRPGDTLDGPALVETRETTLVVGERDRARVDELGNVVVEVGL